MTIKTTIENTQIECKIPLINLKRDFFYKKNFNSNFSLRMQDSILLKMMMKKDI